MSTPFDVVKSVTNTFSKTVINTIKGIDSINNQMLNTIKRADPFSQNMGAAKLSLPDISSLNLSAPSFSPPTIGQGESNGSERDAITPSGSGKGKRF